VKSKTSIFFCEWKRHENQFETKTETNIQQVTGIQVSQPAGRRAQNPIGLPISELLGGKTRSMAAPGAVKISETVQGEAPKR